MSRLSKMWRRSPGEIAWRLAQTARIQRDRVRTRARTPRWERRALSSVLAPGTLDPGLRTSLARADWIAAHHSLARALAERPHTFILDPASAVALREQVLSRWPEAAQDAAARADRLIAGSHDCLGYRDLAYGGTAAAIDWHLDPVSGRRAPAVFWADVPFLDAARIGDHKVIWEINRHQHWLAFGRALWLTGDERYARAIVSQLEEWLQANPPLVGINWASALELGLRSISWLWAMHFLIAAESGEGSVARSDEPWLVDLLLGLDRQMRHVEQNLSFYYSPNTHLLGEALALYAVGLSVPELARSRQWVRTGRRILLDQIAGQIHADGGHAERSLHYHRYTLDFYLLALLLARRSGDGEAVARFTDATSRLAGFAHTMADDRGWLALIGDDDGGQLWPIAGRSCADVRDSLALAAVVLARPELARWGVPEEVFWIAGGAADEQESRVDRSRPENKAPASATFPDTGYVVARDSSGGHLIFDSGAHGFMNGGHAHADALSVTLAVGGRPLLIDPGTGTYTTDLALRDRLRSTASHNTLTLDGRPSSVPSGPFHWQSRADAHLDAVRHNPAFDWAEAAHEGFADQRHRRTIFRAPGGGWLVVDEVLGQATGRQSADLHWHFDPEWQVNREAATCLRATHADGGTAWIVHDGEESMLRRGDESSGLGWFAPVYGRLLPTWTARVSREGIAPFSIATWIAAAPGRPTLTRLPAESDSGGTVAIAVRVLLQDVDFTTVLRPGEPAIRQARGCAAGAYHTDGRMLHYQSRGGRLVALAACDAREVLALRDGWISVAADEPVPDLYLEFGDETIDLRTSAAGARLRLQGALVTAAGRIRVNGRELSDDARERTDSVIVLPSDCGESRRITPCAALQVSQN